MTNQLWKRVKIDDPIEVTSRRARRLWYIVMFGIVYSFVYTAISLFIMVDLSNTLQDTCNARLHARIAIREALSTDPDWTAVNQAQLDIALPPKVSC